MWSFTVRPEWQPKKLGPIQAAILITLKDRQLSVSEIMESLDEYFGDGWCQVRKGTIYPTLRSLSERGYVTLQVAPGRGLGTYQCELTEKGKDVLEKISFDFVDSVDLISRYFDLITDHLRDFEGAFETLYKQMSKEMHPSCMLLLRSVVPLEKTDAKALERYKHFLTSELEQVSDLLHSRKKWKQIKVE